MKSSPCQLPLQHLLSWIWQTFLPLAYSEVSEVCAYLFVPSVPFGEGGEVERKVPDASCSTVFAIVVFIAVTNRINALVVVWYQIALIKEFYVSMKLQRLVYTDATSLLFLSLFCLLLSTRTSLFSLS